VAGEQELLVIPLKIITMVVSGCFIISHSLFYIFMSQSGHFRLLAVAAENICFPTGRFRPKAVVAVCRTTTVEP